MKRFFYILVFCIPFLTSLSGCSNETCSENRSTIPLAGFYDSRGKSLTLDSLMIYGLGGEADSTMVTVPGTRISKVYLPMRTGADQTVWVVSYKQKSLDNPLFNDTLTLDYTSRPYFASAECGVVMTYRLDRLTFTQHLIDSVAVSDSTFTNLDIERIKIYFRTSTSDPDDAARVNSSSAQS